MAAPASSSLLSTLLRLPLAPFSGRTSPAPAPAVVQMPRRAPTAVVVAAKGYNVQILVDENEGEESIFRRFRREVMRAGVLQEIKRRRRYESKKDEKLRKAREAGRRNRRRRMMEEPRFPEEDADSEAARRARDEDKDNWEIDGIL
uniref:30S ribosomal protein S21, chloroplastic n=1 Tax=Leersia perrieri TaxID=77586 RepID=A0A0D9VD54_9ORYZ